MTTSGTYRGHDFGPTPRPAEAMAAIDLMAYGGQSYNQGLQAAFHSAVEGWKDSFDEQGRMTDRDAAMASLGFVDGLSKDFGISPGDATLMSDLAYGVHRGTPIDQRDEKVNNVYEKLGWTTEEGE